MKNIIQQLRDDKSERFIYAPNYWQWFTHHFNHGILPEEIKHCRSQLEITGGDFIISGGISANETSTLKSRDEIFSYTNALLEKMRPHADRFILSASCNTATDTTWETILAFRDAWKEFGK